MQENHACYATKILMSASACWPYGGEIGNLFGTCFFQSCKSFIQTDCTCPLEWLGWFDLHFWIPNFQTHSRKSLVLLFLSLFLLVKSPFFLLLKPWVAAPAPGQCRPWAADVRDPPGRKRSTPAPAAVPDPRRNSPWGPAPKKKGTVQMREILWEIETVLDSYIYIYANKV
jgi:hypothetical protein